MWLLHRSAKRDKATKRHSGSRLLRTRGRLPRRASRQMTLEGLEQRTLLSVTPPLAPAEEAPLYVGFDGVLPFAGDSPQAGTAKRVFDLDLFNGTWSDAEKDATSTEDDLLCWAATASNMLEWTGWGFVGGMVRSDQTLDYFENHWKDVGQTTQNALTWWFDGAGTYGGDVDVAGGAFHPFHDPSTYVHVESDHEDILEFLEGYTDLGSGMGIWIYSNEPGMEFSHEITVWGCNYDPAFEPGDPDRYLGLWITDSDDDKWVADAYTGPNDLHYYAVSWDDDSEIWRMEDYSPGTMIHEAVALDRFANGVVTLNGDQDSVDQADEFNVGLDATGMYLEVRINGDLKFTSPKSQVSQLNLFSWGGDDTLTVDYTHGDPVPAGGLRYDGGTGGNDALTVVGAGGSIGSYLPATIAGEGVVSVDGSAIRFTGLEPVTVSGFFEFTFVTPNSNDDLAIDIPAAGQNRISGTSGDVVFESLSFFDVDHLKIDTAANDQPLGAPNDMVVFGQDLVASGLQSVTVDTGPGNDVVDAANVTTVGLTILGGQGDDVLTGGGGMDNIDGGEGDDQIEAGAGFDYLFGGDGSDQFTVHPGDGMDWIEGGAGEGDQLYFWGSAAAETYYLGAMQTRLSVIRDDGVDFDDALLADVEHVHVFADAGADTITIADLTATGLRKLAVDPSPWDSAADTIEVNGRTVADELTVTAEMVGEGPGTVYVTGLAYDIEIAGAADLDAPIDRLTVKGNDANDTIKAAPGVESAILLTLDGGAGDDFLSADAILIGGPGNDFLEGGAGYDQLFGNDGDDVMVGGAGNDTFDGGAGFDTILVQGTPGNDRIDVNQTAATTLVHTVNGNTQTDTLVLAAGGRTVEAVSVEAGAGDDVILVSWADALGVDAFVNSLRMDVHGGPATARDRLAVVDSGTGDLVLYRKGESDETGSMTVGPGNAEPLEMTFDGIEYAQPVVGVDGDVVVFKHDPFEYNDQRTLATHLGANDTLNVDPTVDPGPDVPFNLPGDEDWFRVEAEYTGTLDFQVFFRHLATVPSGRPGLPGNGDLDIQVFDASGDFIASSLSVDDNERVRIPAVQGQIYFLRVDGFNAAVNNYSITTINTAAPVPWGLELDDAPVGDPPPANSDSGRSQNDNITRVNTPTILIRLDDALFLNDLPGNPAPDSPPDRVIPIPFQAAAGAPGYRIAVFDEGPVPNSPPQTPLGFAAATGTAGVYAFTTPVLLDGSHFLTARVQMVDPATPIQTGFGARSMPLEIFVDTLEPPAAFGLPGDPDDGLHPDSDTGVSPPNQDTIADGITSDTTPTFWGEAEADAIIRLYADTNGDGVLDPGDVFLGQDTAIPLDGNEQEPQGYWEITSVVDLNDPAFFPVPDGLRTIFVTAEDVAGNVNGPEGAADTLEIFIDTQGPVIDAVVISDAPGYDLFDPKPSTDGPTPLVFSLSILFTDPPDRVAPFLYDALKEDVAEHPGHYRVVGDANGVIPIVDVIVTQAIGPGGEATATVELVFLDLGPDGLPFTDDDVGAPLPDDRFTLTVSDSIMDPVGNRLDGESNAVEPQEEPLFPTGDGVPGGTFVARFTVDSRPEVGVWAAGSVWVDTNGNFAFDPTNLDYTNRDIVYTMGFTTDFVFAGNFAGPGPDGTFGTIDDTAAPAASALADGFDKLALYGQVAGAFRWLADTDNDGVVSPPPAGADVAQIDPANIIGHPFAGRFSDTDADPLVDLNGDEVGLLYSTPTMAGSVWWFDTDHDFQVDTSLASELKGYPIVGDFDGDGFDDLATWTEDWIRIDLASGVLRGWDGVADYTFRFGFIGVRERPVAADMDQDGFDDIGLWVPDRAGAVPEESGEWYLLVSHGRSLIERIVPDPSTGVPVIDFTPIPFGHDMYVRYGDEFAIPVLGNFDPPKVAGSPAPIERPVVRAVQGTAGNDSFEFVAAATPGEWTVKVNGVVQHVDAKTAAVTFAGGGGSDTVKLTGTGAGDLAELWAQDGTFSGNGFFVRMSGVESISIDGAGGEDEIVVHDSAYDDTLSASPLQATLSGKNGSQAVFSHTVKGFESLTVLAESGGNDVASLYDSSGDDLFEASLAGATMSGNGYVNQALGFDIVHAFSTNRGSDSARLRDSAGDDRVSARPDFVSLAGSGVLLDVKAFESVTVTADAGGSDLIELTDSRGSDALTAWPESVTLAGKGFSLTAELFERVQVASRSGGADTATLHDSPGPDSLTVKTKLVELSGLGYFVQAQNFKRVQVIGDGGGSDGAEFFGSSGSEKFTASPTKAELSVLGSLVSATGFETVVATAGSAGLDTAYLYDSAESDTFVAKPGEATLSGPGYSLSVKAFDRVYGTASGGYDVAELLGSSGSDTLSADRASVKLSGRGYLSQARLFDEVHASGGGGSDTASISYGQVRSGHLAPGDAQLPSQLAQLAWLADFDRISVRNTWANGGYRSIRALDQAFTAYWQ